MHVSSMNNAGTTIFDVMLYADEMLFYRYNCREEDGETLKESTTISFNAERFHNCLKSINSAGGVSMYYDSESQAMVLTPDLKDHFGDDAAFVPALHSGGDIYGIDDEYTVEPFRIGVTEFCAGFKKAVDLKCKSLSLKWHNQSLIMAGYSHDNLVLYRCKSFSGLFDEMDYENEDIDAAIREISAGSGLRMSLSEPPGMISFLLPIGAVKALCKIKQVAHPRAVVKLYFQEGMDLQLRCPVASSGVMKIYIKNSP